MGCWVWLAVHYLAVVYLSSPAALFAPFASAMIYCATSWRGRHNARRDTTTQCEQEQWSSSELEVCVGEGGGTLRGVDTQDDRQ